MSRLDKEYEILCKIANQIKNIGNNLLLKSDNYFKGDKKYLLLKCPFISVNSYLTFMDDFLTIQEIYSKESLPRLEVIKSGITSTRAIDSCTVNSEYEKELFFEMLATKLFNKEYKSLTSNEDEFSSNILAETQQIYYKLELFIKKLDIFVKKLSSSVKDSESLTSGVRSVRDSEVRDNEVRDNEVRDSEVRDSESLPSSVRSVRDNDRDNEVRDDNEVRNSESWSKRISKSIKNYFNKEKVPRSLSTEKALSDIGFIKKRGGGKTRRKRTKKRKNRGRKSRRIK